MELIENLFVGGNVSDLETIVYSLRREVPVLRLYCIVYFEDKNRLELLSSHELFHTRNKNRPAKIAGIAMGREETVVYFFLWQEKAQEEGQKSCQSKGADVIKNAYEDFLSYSGASGCLLPAVCSADYRNGNTAVSGGWLLCEGISEICGHRARGYEAV